MEITLFAASDFHLGMTFSSYGTLGADLERARLETLERCVETANREECRLFVVAGDLFDKQNLPVSTVEEAARLLTDFAGDCICVLPGNHDYLSGKGSVLWDRFSKVIDERILLLTSPRPYDLSPLGIDIVLYPGPCDSRTSPENRIGWITEPAGGGDGSSRETEPAAASPSGTAWRIGIAHGSVRGLSPDTGGRYFPMTLEELKQAGLDLWIVGHTHIMHPDPPGPVPRGGLLVPGTPEPDGFDCSHAGSGWLVRLRDGEGRRSISVEPRQVGRYRFFDERAEIRGEDDLERLEAKLLAAERNPRGGFLRLDLEGSLEKDRFSRVGELKERLEKTYGYVRIDSSGISEIITPADIDDEFTRGSFPHRLLSRLAEEEDTRSLQCAYELLKEARG
jgi:DNA repair exonuclease SbcCD nuclease subunit